VCFCFSFNNTDCSYCFRTPLFGGVFYFYISLFTLKKQFYFMAKATSSKAASKKGASKGGTASKGASSKGASSKSASAKKGSHNGFEPELGKDGSNDFQAQAGTQEANNIMTPEATDKLAKQTEEAGETETQTAAPKRSRGERGNSSAAKGVTAGDQNSQDFQKEARAASGDTKKASSIGDFQQQAGVNP
jgi:hypothetical protein